MDMDKQAKALCARHDTLLSEAATWMTLWQEISNYVMPRKSQIQHAKTEGIEGFTDDLYNLTAVQANGVLASGQKDYMVSGDWFELKSPMDKPDDATERWYRKGTEIMMAELARSNFHAQVHEAFLDRGGFGIASLSLEEGIRSLFNFRKFDVGTFVCAQDEEGYVDTVFRQFDLTTRQALNKFGEENLSKSILVALASDDVKQMEKKFTFIHAVYPRSDAERDLGKIDGPNKPIASFYVCKDDIAVVRVSGYDEMPIFTTRFLKWGDTPYGFSPSIAVLPTVKQVNFIEQQMDALAEIAAFPRILIPNGLDGEEVDLRSGGQTVYNPADGDNAKPEEWGTSGRYDIGKDRIELKDNAIREAFHNDLFHMLRDLEKGEMTAYEVSRREAEKVADFSPTFYTLDGEVLQPMLSRAFGMMFRAGRFEDPPAGAFALGPDGMSPVLPMPKVVLTGKLATAIKAANNNSWMEFMALMDTLFQVDPSIVLDNYDTDKVARGSGSNTGVDVDWLRPENERDEMRAARAAAEQKAAQAEQAPGLAKAAKDVSEVPAEQREQMGMGQ